MEYYPTAEQAVENGIALLNAWDESRRLVASLDTRPPWFHRVSAEGLRLSHSRLCVLGQLGGSKAGGYVDMTVKLGIATSSSQAWYGFEEGFWSADCANFTYEDLQPIWERRIRDLQTTTPAPRR